MAPGLTIRDRLRVLQPNDPDSYYQDRELIPGDMVGDNNRPWSLGGVLLLPPGFGVHLASKLGDRKSFVLKRTSA